MHEGYVYFSTEDGTVGKLKTYSDFFDVKEIFAHQFENGKYGFVSPDGKILIDGVYDETPLILWHGIGYVGNEYICARQGDIAYLIGKKGIIHKKKNGFYGYKYRTENYKTKEKRYSCGTHIYFNFNKVNSSKGFHDKLWVGVDEFEKSFEIKELLKAANKQYGARLKAYMESIC